jgi:hypothetical protein
MIVPRFWPSSKTVISLTETGIRVSRTTPGSDGNTEHVVDSIPELGRLVWAQVWPRSNTKVYVLGKQAH